MVVFGARRRGRHTAAGYLASVAAGPAATLEALASRSLLAADALTARAMRDPDPVIALWCARSLASPSGELPPAPGQRLLRSAPARSAPSPSSPPSPASPASWPSRPAPRLPLKCWAKAAATRCWSSTSSGRSSIRSCRATGRILPRCASRRLKRSDACMPSKPPKCSACLRKAAKDWRLPNRRGWGRLRGGTREPAAVGGGSVRTWERYHTPPISYAPKAPPAVTAEVSLFSVGWTLAASASTHNVQVAFPPA